MFLKKDLLMLVFGLFFIPLAVSAQNSTTALESSIQCKQGTTFTLQTIESHFRELGLEKGIDGFYFPAKGKKVIFLSDEILAASVFNAADEKKLAIYLKNQTGKQLAKKFRTTTIDEYANTDDPSYIKQTSTKTTLLIGAADELDTGTQSIPFRSSIICQVLH